VGLKSARLSVALLLAASAARADDDISVSAGALARLRYEYVRNSDWGRDEPDDNGYFMSRFMLHAELRVGAYLRTFIELKSGLITGRNGGPRPTDKDELDVNQAFVELSAPPMDMHLRVGRQELAFGSSRLVSVRDGPNVRRPFEGVRAWFRVEEWRADAFVVAPVETDPGVFDDGREEGQWFWGLYVTGPVVDWLSLDIYYLGLRRREAAFEQGSAGEWRHSLGMRMWGKAAGWDHNTELVYQLGSFGPGTIRAWTAASDTGYTIAGLAGRPRVGLKANVTSGDDDPQDPDLQTFNPLFPKGSYFGEASLVGPLNHIDLDPSVTLHPMDDLSIQVDGDFFWRESLADGLYRSSGSVQVSGAGNSARYVGAQASLTIEWKLNPFLSLTGAYAHFFAGSFLREAGVGRDVDFVAIWMTARTPASD
jgi:hypothetical protein